MLETFSVVDGRSGECSLSRTTASRHRLLGVDWKSQIQALSKIPIGATQAHVRQSENDDLKASGSAQMVGLSVQQRAFHVSLTVDRTTSSGVSNAPFVDLHWRP